MNTSTLQQSPSSALLRVVLGLSVPLMTAGVQAVEFGPFTLSGFVKLEASADLPSAAEDLLLRFTRVWTPERIAA